MRAEGPLYWLRCRGRQACKRLSASFISLFGRTHTVNAKPKHNPPPVRCAWARTELMIRYHDEEWGVPVHNDRTLFEFLILEGAQAGLSWETILKKRENYRAALDGFDFQKIARYDRRKLAHLLKDPGIVRNRLKIASTVKNAQAMLKVQEEFGSLNDYVWQFVSGRPRINHWTSQVPARTPESDALSKDLRKRSFTFVGSTICYAFMQAVGMVNDHTVRCFRHTALAPSSFQPSP